MIARAGIAGLYVGLLFLLTGCRTVNPVARPSVITATRATTPLLIDGRLDEPVWQKATKFNLSFSKDTSKTLQEGGVIQLAYDDQFLYLAAELFDSDVLQESDEDQQQHFLSGDVLELFIHPKNKPYYWELYVTPNQRRTVYFFEGAGRFALPSSFVQSFDWLRVGTQVQGSLNDPSDLDRGWTAEMAVQLSVLAEKGIPFDKHHAWTVLIGRYNYTLHLPEKEISMAPALPKTNFHKIGNYADLKLLPPQPTVD